MARIADGLSRPVGFAVAAALVCGIAASSDLEGLLHRAVGADPADYLAIRNQLLRDTDLLSAFVGRMRPKATRWEERVLLDILDEHLTKAAEIQASLKSGIAIPIARGWEDRVAEHAKALAERFKSTPMALVEFLWKGNELSRIVNSEVEKKPLADPEEGNAYVARALGLLREKRAVWVLMWRVENDADTRVVIEAGEAVRRLGMPEVLDDLLRIATTGKDHPARTAALNAVASCARPELLAKVEAAGRHTSDPVLTASLETIAKRLRAVTASEETLPPREEVGSPREPRPQQAVPVPQDANKDETERTDRGSSEQPERSGASPGTVIWAVAAFFLGITVGSLGLYVGLRHRIGRGSG